MKKLLFLGLLAVLFVQPNFVFAHGDEGHDDMPGMEMGAHDQMGQMHEDNEATLKEAASILKTTRPDLAMKLEKMAEDHDDMKS